MSPRAEEELYTASKYLKENSPERRVRLLSDPDEDENSRNMVCMSDLDNEGDPESGLCVSPSVPEFDSIETVRSQVVLQEFQEPECRETVINEIMEMILEPSGSKLSSKNNRVSTPRVGMSSEKLRSSHPKPKLMDSRVYSYDEMVEG